eukprot:13029006-Alexandrium_andersonii.AAC.1
MTAALASLEAPSWAHSRISLPSGRGNSSVARGGSAAQGGVWIVARAAARAPWAGRPSLRPRSLGPRATRVCRDWATREPH